MFPDRSLVQLEQLEHVEIIWIHAFLWPKNYEYTAKISQAPRIFQASLLWAIRSLKFETIDGEVKLHLGWGWVKGFIPTGFGCVIQIWDVFSVIVHAWVFIVVFPSFVLCNIVQPWKKSTCGMMRVDPLVIFHLSLCKHQHLGCVFVFVFFWGPYYIIHVMHAFVHALRALHS